MENDNLLEIDPMKWIDELSSMIEGNAEVCEKLVREDPEVRDAVETIHEFLVAITSEKSHDRSHDWRKEGF